MRASFLTWCAHGTAALSWTILLCTGASLSLQLVHNTPTSKNSEGKPGVTHIVELSLHVGHVPHLEETHSSAQAPPRQGGRASLSRFSFSPRRGASRALTML